MDNVNEITVICQLLSLLPINIQERLLLDRYAKKLTIVKSIPIFVAAQLNLWSSYNVIESTLRAQPELLRFLNLSSISGAQLSRKLDQIPTELLEWLFLQGVARLEQVSGPNQGITARIGKLCVIDSSTIQLPLQLCNWARLSRNESSVKMHLRLRVDSPDAVFPDAMIPTSSNISDRDMSVELVIESDSIYVMDRGYDHYKRMDDWVRRHIRFVMRVRSRTFTRIIESYPVPEQSSILCDAKVYVGAKPSFMEQPVRLIEFLDEKGRIYRILTSVWNLSAEEIAKVYKSRWLIELFFKWIKQHLRIKKLHSYKTQAIWNQLFIGLITALLVQIVQKTTETKRSTWQVLQLMRTYMYHNWQAFTEELHRVPSKTSRGRQCGSQKSPPNQRTTIGKIKPQM